MTKSLRSFKEQERAKIAALRAESKTGGLGMLAAQDYRARKTEQARAKAKAAAEAEQATKASE